MTQEPSPRWNQPAPGAAPAAWTPQRRWRLLGNVSLVLAILDLLYCVIHILTPYLSRPLLDFERKFLATTPHGPDMGGLMDAAEKYTARMAPWEALRTLPFMIASCILVWIAIRLRRGDSDALRTARVWAFGAFGAVAVSLLIQIVVIVPATIEYQHEIMGLMFKTPAGSKAPFDIGAVAGSTALASLMVTVVMGALGLSVWPAAMLIWTGQLIRETLSPGLAR